MLRVVRGGARSRGAFWANVSSITAGTVAGQAFVLALSPILTRLYGPADFGALGLYATALALLTVLATLRYELAFPVDRGEDAQSLVLLVLLTVSIMSALSAVAVVFFGRQLLSAVNADSLAPYLWLVPIGTAASGVLQLLTYLRVRQGAYNQLATSRLTQSVASGSAQVFLAPLGGLGLIIGFVAGRLLGALQLARGEVRPRASIRSVARTAVRLRRFPLLTMWSSLANTIGLQFPVIVLAAAFGPAVVGLYALTLRVTQAPATIVGQAVAQVFLGGLSRARDERVTAAYSWQAFSSLALAAITPAALACLWAPDAFAFVFGDEWRTAGEMATALLPWIALSFIGQPFASLAFAFAGQGVDFAFQILLAGARLATLVVGVWVASDYLIAIQAFGVASALVWMAYLIWLLSLAGVSKLKTIGLLLSLGAAGLLAAAPVIAANVASIEGTGRAAASTASAAMLVIAMVAVRAQTGGKGLPTSEVTARRFPDGP